MKPIMIFVFSAPLNTFQRIWPLLVTVEITLSLARVALASTTGVFPFGAYSRDGIDGSVLDPALSGSGDVWFSGIPRECAVRKECARTEK
jgi:hypothetical protein